MNNDMIRKFTVLTALAVLLNPALFAAAIDDLEPEFGNIVLLQPMQDHKWAQVTSDSEYVYTSNELLLPDTGLQPAQNDGLFHETLGLNVTPPACPLNSLLFVRQEYVRYAENKQYDYNAQSAGAQISHPVEDWFSIYGGGSAERLVLIGNNQTFFKAYDAQIGIWRQQKINQSLAVYGGYQFDWRPSTPGEYSRIENTPFIGLNASLLPDLTAKLEYRISAREYTKQSRNDLNQYTGLTLTYNINEYADLSAFVSYSRNDSSIATSDYEVFSGGGGLNLNVRF